MVKTNREKLLEIGVIGEITHSSIDLRYVNNWDGKPSLGIGQGGIAIMSNLETVVLIGHWEKK